MATVIKFGTSGWRAIIADDFTFANVRLAAAAIADHVRSRNAKPTLIVGHDTRFFAEEFSLTASQILREHGVHVLLCEHATPTPANAFEQRGPQYAYLERLEQVSNYTAMSAVKLSIVTDPLHGGRAGYLDHTLAADGVSRHAIRTDRHIPFGFKIPDVAEENLRPLRD